MIKEQVLLIGGGGHCKSVIEAIESEGKYTIFGILDVAEKVGQKILGYQVIGNDNELPEFLKACPNAVITVGQLKSAASRIRIYNQLKENNAILPVIVADSAVVSKHASVAEGTVILHGAVVNADVRIGKNNIINTGAIIEHDADIGDHCHISTSAVINGGCKIGEEVLIGSNSVLKQGVKIASKVVIGAGSVVIKDVSEPAVLVGNPAREK